MISLLKQLEWNYIVVIYDMDTYGTEGYYALKVRSKEENILQQSNWNEKLVFNKYDIKIWFYEFFW